MITERQAAEVKEERYDLFSGLLDASNADDERGSFIIQVDIRLDRLAVIRERQRGRRARSGGR